MRKITFTYCRLQYNPTYEFHSGRSGITLQLSDSYQVRNDILGQLKRNTNTWFELALGRAPMELQATLQVDIFHFYALCVYTEANESMKEIPHR